MNTKKRRELIKKHWSVSDGKKITKMIQKHWRLSGKIKEEKINSAENVFKGLIE